MTRRRALWFPCLVAASLLAAALPGLSTTLPGADALQETTTGLDESTDGLLDTEENGTEDTGDGTDDSLDGTTDDGSLSNLTGDGTWTVDDLPTMGPGTLSATCQAHPAEDGRLVCTPTATCKEQLYRSRACIPPPQCVDEGNATFICHPRERFHELVPAGPYAAPGSGSPACLPSLEAWGTMVCQLPTGCTEDPMTSPACQPGPRCSLHDGHAICHGDRTDQPTADPEVSGQALSRTVQTTLSEALDPFHVGIDQLRASYQDGMAAINASYQADRAQARETYVACLEQAADQEDLAQADACRQQARLQLEELRAQARADAEALRERLLVKAEILRSATCQHVTVQLEGVLSQAGVTDVRLDRLAATWDVGLCSGPPG